MCTCITYQTQDFYFGRNMDLEYTFGEQVMVMPRNYVLSFKKMNRIEEHYAMIGMACSTENYPLYAEAVNEKGLCMAGLNFPENAVYHNVEEKKINITPYELIPWTLSQCASVDEAILLLAEVNLINVPFKKDLPAAPLHWMICDKKKSLVLEPLKEGLRICENPIGVLTNNPVFDYHLENLNNYLNVTSSYPQNRFTQRLRLKPYGQGMGAIGLPGDYSSASRFVRAAFLKWNSVCKEDELSSITQVFHVLDGVSMVRGSVLTPQGKYDMTTYSCCVNADRGIYYYKTYENHQIHAVKLFENAVDGNSLLCYPLGKEQAVHYC